VVAAGLVELFGSIDTLGHVASSTIRIILAVLIATVAGMALAMLGHSVPLMRVIVFDRIQPFLNSMPSAGWALFGVIWFGTNHFTIIFVVVMILMPFALVNIAEGLRELDREALEMARSFTRNRRKIFFKMTLPLLMPYIMGALRIGYGVGWKVGIIAELFGGESGIGFVIQRAQTVTDNVTVFAACFAMVVLFWAGEKLVLDPLARRYQRG
jgi:NitT/TauT family transport system permease protein